MTAMAWVIAMHLILPRGMHAANIVLPHAYATLPACEAARQAKDQEFRFHELEPSRCVFMRVKRQPPL